MINIKVNNTYIQILIDDITNQDTQAIVNAANNSLLGGGGVDGAIHKKAGPKLLRECIKLNGCKTGNAKITKAYNLKSKYIIHTVGPIYRNDDDASVLKSAYLNSLKVAENNNIKSISFPSISTGAYGYPIEKASKIAIDTIFNYVNQNTLIEKIKIVLYSEKDYNVYAKTLEKSEFFINVKVD
ncbi:MAG TPA: O-acetyl-ADP-ribose deacetylase [Tissierellaceae bacterium]